MVRQPGTLTDAGAYLLRREDSVLANRGDGAFGDPVGHGVGRDPTSVVAADLGATRGWTSPSRTWVPAPSPSS